MRLFTVLVAVAASIAACSDGGGASAPNDAKINAPASEVSPGRNSIYAAARGQEPEAYVRALYAAVSVDALGQGLPPGQDPIFSRMMNARIGADAMRPQGAPQVLDWDPLCDCEDGKGLALADLRMQQADTRAAQARVTVEQSGSSRVLVLNLVKEGPMWRIEDVTPEGGPSLSERVMRGID